MKIMFVGAVILLCFVASIVFCIIAWIMTMKKNRMAHWASMYDNNDKWLVFLCQNEIFSVSAKY